MRFLLVGGIGYVGGRLAAHLKRRGHYVRVTTRRDPASGPAWLLADDIRQVDPFKTGAYNAVLASIDTVIHLAALDEIQAAQNPPEALRVATDGTRHLLDALVDVTPNPTFIYLSTFHVYGPNVRGVVDETTPPAPVHPYAVAKFEGERVVQEFRKRQDLRAICLRLSNTFGAPAGDTIQRETLVMTDLCRQAASKRELVLKSTGTQKRNFITLADTVRAIEFLAERPGQWPTDAILNVGSDAEWSIREAAEKVAQATQSVLGFQPPILIAPNAPTEKQVEFRFSIERLRKLGFQFKGSWEDELKSTLLLCRGAAQPHA